MSAMMRLLAGVILISAIFGMGIMVGSGPATLAADNKPQKKIEVELTESFYRALRSEGATKRYSTDKSDEYLRQIAVSSRFTVESNLQILKGQERIIELLETLRDQKK